MAVSYMTKDGYDKILAEINYLETVKRPYPSPQRSGLIFQGASRSPNS